MRQTISAITIGIVACAALAAAQPPGGGPGIPGARMGGPGEPGLAMSQAPIPGAPFSAEGVTTTTQTLADGTRIERTVTAKIYRDNEGRVRREQTVVGLSALNVTGEAQTISIVDPVARITYSLNPANHTGLRSPMPVPAGRGRAGGAPPPPPPPPGGDANAAGSPPPPPPPPDALGTRQIEGLTAVGVKRTQVIPTGRIGNDRPIEISDERWESTELRVLLLSRHHDPRTGDVEYRLTNINRGEPSRELFAVPSDYTITDAPPPPPPAPRRPE
jgi:hypothetical protein